MPGENAVNMNAARKYELINEYAGDWSYRVILPANVRTEQSYIIAYGNEKESLFNCCEEYMISLKEKNMRETPRHGLTLEDTRGFIKYRGKGIFLIQLISSIYRNCAKVLHEENRQIQLSVVDYLNLY